MYRDKNTINVMISINSANENPVEVTSKKLDGDKYEDAIRSLISPAIEQTRMLIERVYQDKKVSAIRGGIEFKIKDKDH